ncbi:hypothetical protein M231_02279 [Tremella mesenterica]|uniref:Rab proteins geranylgeranyltransferase n=1 Tax=Tremella mesenterica TaxID=5217 RepID=A0A4Q1BR59_TREME|nr:hypothetical protein M231_02279 [Tremella mesenterica]
MSPSELESDTYDVVVIGTNLSGSIVAASLAKAGKSILHIDPNEYYGSSHSSLTLDELIQWSSLHSSPSLTSHQYSQASTSTLTPSLHSDRRRYALSLYPAILPSRGSMIQTLIDSEVSKYVSFRLLGSVSVYNSTQPLNSSGEKEETGMVKNSKEVKVRRVPGSKEDIFKDTSINLRDKRKLMKFLLWASGSYEITTVFMENKHKRMGEFLKDVFGLDVKLADQICYAIAHCDDPEEKVERVLGRMNRYLKSIGRYGSGAFLVGQYGSAGEVAQGFCRACAVYGGTYVLGPSAKLESISASEDGVILRLPCHPRDIKASKVISTAEHLPENLRPAAAEVIITTAQCIAILPSFPELLRQSRGSSEGTQTEEEGSEENEDTAVLLFPPEGEMGLVRALIMGEGTGSCPPRQWILYLSSVVSESTPPKCLEPYLSRLSSEPLFSAFYFSHRPKYDIPAEKLLPSDKNIVLLRPCESLDMTEGMDWEAKQAEAAFWQVVGKDGQVGYFEKTEEGEESE